MSLKTLPSTVFIRSGDSKVKAEGEKMKGAISIAQALEAAGKEKR
ncbi:MAG: hypothetical protein RLZZ555_950 [Pseudomonadota bacterium]|jgi:hypothetical protein